MNPYDIPALACSLSLPPSFFLPFFVFPCLFFFHRRPPRKHTARIFFGHLFKYKGRHAELPGSGISSSSWLPVNGSQPPTARYRLVNVGRKLGHRFVINKVLLSTGSSNRETTYNAEEAVKLRRNSTRSLSAQSRSSCRLRSRETRNLLAAH